MTGSGPKLSILALIVLLSSSILVSVPGAAMADTREGVRQDPGLSLSRDLVYAGAETVITIVYSIPSLPVDIRVEQVNVTFSNATYEETIYTYNHTVDSPGSPDTELDHPVNSTLSADLYSIEVHVWYYNTTDGIVYHNHTSASLRIADPLPMIGSAMASPSMVANSGQGYSEIIWTVDRSFPDLIGVIFNVWANGSASGLWEVPMDLDLLEDDPGNFSYSEDGMTTFRYNWTIPLDLTPGVYLLNLSVLDRFGFTETLLAPIVEVIWSERSPIMVNDTVLLLEDAYITIDLDDHFDDLNGQDLTYVLNTTRLMNVTVTHVSGTMYNVSAEPDWYGTELLDVTVNDSVSPPIAFELHIEVVNVNDAPMPAVETIYGEKGSQIIVDLNNAFSDLDGPANISFIVLGNGDNITLDLANSGILTITPDDGWWGESNITVWVSDGIDNMTYEIPVLFEWPVHYVTGSISFEDADVHIPEIPGSNRTVTLSFTGEKEYSIVVNETGSFLLSMDEGVYMLSIEIGIPGEFLYDPAEGRSGYLFEERTMTIDQDTDMPLLIGWMAFSLTASFDDIDFNSTRFVKEEGEWWITVPVMNASLSGYDEIPLSMIVVTEEENHSYPLIWNSTEGVFSLRLFKTDLQDIDKGEVEYYFTDGSRVTDPEKFTFVDEDETEANIVTIAILVILIILVLVALVLIMRKPAEDEDFGDESGPEEETGRVCDSCGEPVPQDKEECPNCGESLEE